MNLRSIKIIISKSNTTSEIKEAFSQKFPGLKLEFFKEDHQVNEMSLKEDLIENNVLLSALNANLIEGEMLFQPTSTTILFEKELRNRFGLNAQGTFESMKHRHEFKETGYGTIMIDNFEFSSPLGIIGKLVDYLFLKRYMTKFLAERNKIIKDFAETDKWKQIL